MPRVVALAGGVGGAKLAHGLAAVLASAHEQRIRRLSLEQTEALMEALLDLRTPDDLRAWLVAQGAPPI